MTETAFKDVQPLNGGRVLVVGGSTKAWESYRGHPQIEFWSGDQADMRRHLKNKDIPTNVKVVIISRFISHSEVEPLMHECRKRQLRMYHNLPDGQVSDLLERLTERIEVKPKVEPKRPERGQLKELITKHDNPQITIAESARAMMILLEEKGIKSTFSSVAQAIGKYRRERGLSSPPPSVKRQDPVADLVNFFDDAVASMQLMRETVVKLATENKDLKAQLARVKSVLGSD